MAGLKFLSFRVSTYTCTQLLLYLWYKYQQQNGSSTDEEPSAIHHSKYVLKILQSDERHQYDSQHDTADINGSDDEGGVVQTLDVDFPDGEGEDECHDLEDSLVAVHHADGDGAID